MNKDGVVSEEELVRILMWPTPDGTAMSRDLAKEFINRFEQFDKNGDGV